MTEAYRYRCKLVKETSFQYSRKISSPGDIAQFAEEAGLFDEAEEVLSLICLDAKGRVIGLSEVSRGSACESMSHPREILKRALLCNAASMVIMHNHPSGDPTPSEEDKRATGEIKKCCELMRIPLIDHIVLGENSESYYSFMANEW